MINTINDSGTQNISFAIYGQMRSGKTSILLHLMQDLRQNPKYNSKYLVVYLNSMGGFFPEEGASVFSQILWRILEETQAEIREKVENGFSPLFMELPQNLREFCGHPAVGQYFISLFKTFLQRASQTQDWQKIKIIVCIDEFTYLYEYIIKGDLPGEFMHYWKAILQENLFSTILVGTDAMPKFIDRFSNDLAVSEKSRVTYLSRDSAKMLIENPIRMINGESRYKEQSVDYIIKLTAGSAFFIQKLCDRLVQYMNRNKIELITQADVINLKNEILRSERPQDWHFNNIIMSGDTSSDAISQKDIEAVLKEIALNSSDGFCHRNDIKYQTGAKLDDILNDLENRDVIESEVIGRDGQKKYKIKVELYKEWLLKSL